MCASACALIWMGGETGRKFIYRNQGTGLCFHQASNSAGPPGVLPGPSSGPGNALISKYLADLGYNAMIEWVTKADPYHLICLNPEVAKKKFNIDFWYNTEDGAALYPAGEPRIASSGATGAIPIPRRRRHPPQPEPSQRVDAEFASSGATPLV